MKDLVCRGRQRVDGYGVSREKPEADGRLDLTLRCVHLADFQCWPLRRYNGSRATAFVREVVVKHPRKKGGHFDETFEVTARPEKRANRARETRPPEAVLPG